MVLFELVIPPGVTFAWYLDRVEDRNGNVIEYIWEGNSFEGERFISEIRYSSHINGLISSLPNFGSVNDGSLQMIV